VRPRLVLDTNVLVSHFVLPGRNPSKVLDLVIAGKAILLVSDFILDELEGILSDRLRFPASEARPARDSILAVSEIANPRHAVDIIRSDESDNRILEAAVSGNADVIVTGDRKHLLPLGTFRGIPIMSPLEFLKRFVP
jgi:putative PIN family toxin of toxin-antitoxin system